MMTVNDVNIDGAIGSGTTSMTERMLSLELHLSCIWLRRSSSCDSLCGPPLEVWEK